MRSEQEMASGPYYDYTNQAYPDSPDTFYAQVNVQPPSSDSAQTPPSPTYSKSRRSVARPSQAHASSNTQSSSSPSYSAHRTSKSTRGPSSHVRRERERQLANTPRDDLIRQIISKEHEYTEAKHLLTSAILQVESLQDRLAREEKSRKALEEETRVIGLKTTKAILDSQNETIRSKEDIGFYKLQQQNTERQLRHANERLRAVEKERDDADRALVRARSTARQLKEDNVLFQAREEGRREGFEQGLRQGRVQQESLPPEGEPRKKERKTSNPPGPVAPTAEQEQALAALRAIDEKEKLRIGLQLNDIERKLDTERQKTKDLERVVKRMRAEKANLEQDKQKTEDERDQARRELETLERDKEDLKKREAEALRRASSERRKLTEENEKEKREIREIRREKERAEREKQELEEKAREDLQRERDRARKAEEDRERDREREREREKEREREQREKEKEMSETIAAATAAAVSAVVGAATSSRSSPDHTGPTFHDYRSQPYIPMPAPPAGAPPIDMPTPIVMPVPDLPSSAGTSRSIPGYPRAGSSGSQRGHHGRPRRDSFSSGVSTTQLGLLQLPDRERGDSLSVIPEDASVRAPSPGWGASAWSNPPGSTFPVPVVPNIVPRGGTPGVGNAFPTPEIPNIIPKGVASGGIAFPVNNPNGPSMFPQPEIPNIVPKGGVSGVSFPTPEVPNIIPRGGPSPGGGSQFPEPVIPNIIPKGGYAPGSISGVEFPQPVIPNIVAKGNESLSGSGVAFPTPEVPNIIPKAGSGGYTTPGGGVSFPTPEVPNIIPKGTAGGYTPGGGISFPNPEVPNIVGRGESSSAGIGVAFPTPEIPNIVGKGGQAGAPSPGSGNMFPTPEIPNIVGRAGSSHGRHTPGGSGISFPTPEVPNIVGAAARGPSPGSGSGLFPIPEVPNIIPKGATSGGVAFPNPEIPNIVPKVGSSGSGGFPTPHIPNIIPKGQGGVSFPTPEVPDIVPKGGSQPSVPSAGFPTPVIPNILPKGKKGKNAARNGSSRPETPSVFPAGAGSISRGVDFPTPEVPNIVPPKGASSSAFGGSSPSWPSAQIPSNSGGNSGWPTSSTSGNMQGGMPSSPYSNPTLLRVRNNSAPLRMPSIGSTGSWDVKIQPPSRPPSSASPANEQNAHWLSPNHSTTPLPKSQPRGGNVPTQPNTPVVLSGPLPPGFVAQTITDARGISTPVYQPNVLPGMGPPVIPPLSGSNIYKNPVNRDEPQPSVFGGAGPVFPHSPAGSVRPLGTPGPTWGTLGGMTPNATTRDLPSSTSRGSVFGGASPGLGASLSMPVPTVPNFEEENNEDITAMNTKLNATIGSSTANKKKKKKR